MEITDIRIRKIDGTGKMKAIVSVTFDDMFVIHDMKIMEGASGLFIAMPSRKTPSGEYKDIACLLYTSYSLYSGSKSLSKKIRKNIPAQSRRSVLLLPL